MKTRTVTIPSLEIVFTHEDEEGVETEYHLPAVYEVCHRCQGHGTVRPDWYATSRDFEEDDYDFRQDYLNGFRQDYLNGKYDQPCPSCKGMRVIAVTYPNKDYYSFKDQKTLKLYFSLLREEREYEALCAAERRMGA